MLQDLLAETSLRFPWGCQGVCGPRQRNGVPSF